MHMLRQVRAVAEAKASGRGNDCSPFRRFIFMRETVTNGDSKRLSLVIPQLWDKQIGDSKCLSLVIPNFGIDRCGFSSVHLLDTLVLFWYISPTFCFEREPLSFFLSLCPLPFQLSVTCHLLISHLYSVRGHAIVSTLGKSCLPWFPFGEPFTY